MDKDELESKIKEGVSLFKRNNEDLLRVDANERSMTFKFGEVLQSVFIGWNVDCEYNRDGYEPKRIGISIEDGISSDDTEAKTVFPDIIIHHRILNGRNNNLLIIEAKKDATEIEKNKDCEKIKLIMNDLEYQYGIFLNFHTKSPFEIEYVFIPAR